MRVCGCEQRAAFSGSKRSWLFDLDFREVQTRSVQNVLAQDEIVLFRRASSVLALNSSASLRRFNVLTLCFLLMVR